MSPRGKATLAAATTGVLVGATMVSTRAVSSHASPETLAFHRYLIGLCVLAVPLLFCPRTRFSLKDAVGIATLGIFQFAILIVLLNYALKSLSAATCALVFSTMPLFTMSLAVVLRRERFHPTKLIGLLLAFCGIGFLLGPAASPSMVHTASPAAPTALIALVAATLIGAFCSILYRPYLQRYPALPTSALAMCAAVVFLGCLCWGMSQALVPHLSTAQWGNVIFIGLSSGLGYFCWLWALARMDASRVVAFQALGPVTAATIELFNASQFPSWQLLMSIVLVVAGLLVALRKVDRRSTPLSTEHDPAL